ncbi:glutamyl-tRNA reductase [Parasediminibacterium sp. JCM 36343]|uniref:glutamyl-tRNA reductase n=1 Tax=Parasediminibacterium sp. JCM 36343 TaxID=3374279 RepID=UPI00397E9170
MTGHLFFAAGINYKKTEASIRGQFAVGTEQYLSLIEGAKQAGISEVLVISTCNRTEIYGLATSAKALTQLLCSTTTGDIDTFNRLSYTKKGAEAITHLFSVGAGLDSQILGDYEIIGQIKQAFKFSKEHGGIGSFMERLVNSVIQASKSIKNNTALSGGTVSVAFAAIQFLKENVVDISDKKILLLGTGKIGRNTCKNVVDYLNNTNITLINRTADKAKELADELNLKVGSYELIEHEIQAADIIIVATNAATPIIHKAHFSNGNAKVLIDLSIPNNIAPDCKSLAHITLVNVDDLAKINDATLQKRMAEVPKAKAIIAEHITEFNEWQEMRKNVPVIKAVKSKLLEMQDCTLFNTYYTTQSNAVGVDHHVKIQKVINNMAANMRKERKGGCNFIEAINEFIA